MIFNRNFYLASAVLAAMATPSFSQDTPDADTVLATVDGVDITFGHVVSLVADLPEQYDQVPADELLNGVLDQMIQQTLLSDKKSLSKTQLKLAMENSERALLATARLEKVAAEATTEEALREAYDASKETAPVIPQFRASHILVETEDEAKDLVKALEEGADFAELAREKSTGPSGPSGGDLGWFGLGAMVAPFEEAVVALEVGEFSQPVQTQFGWHVLKLFETRDYLPFEEVRTELEDAVRQGAIVSVIEDLESAAKIERAELNFDPALVRDASILD